MIKKIVFLFLTILSCTNFLSAQGDNIQPKVALQLVFNLYGPYKKQLVAIYNQLTQSLNELITLYNEISLKQTSFDTAEPSFTSLENKINDMVTEINSINEQLAAIPSNLKNPNNAEPIRKIGHNYLKIANVIELANQCSNVIQDIKQLR